LTPPAFPTKFGLPEGRRSDTEEKEKMHNFEFVKPASVADAVAALSTDEAQPLSGGQTLLPTMKQRLAAPSKLVSLTGIPEMQGVCMDDAGRICIGGATTHAAVARDAAAHFPALADLAGRIGDPMVRNKGTMGGSVANNDPAACYPAAVLATGATVVTSAREIAAEDYFQGMFTTALDEGEIVTEVKFPVPEVASYQKFLQPASRFALTGVFVAKYADGVRVAVTGASEEGVFRWTEAEEALSADFSPAAVEGLSVSSDGLIADLHATPAYRANLIKVMTKRAVAAAV
jgi:carbon-monoxide dehydrogenase medium subunit